MWIKELPTHPGYYWYVESSGVKRIVLIAMDERGPYETNTQNGDVKHRALSGKFWSEPISEPPDEDPDLPDLLRLEREVRQEVFPQDT